MKEGDNYLNKASIDSFKWRIELDKVDILNNNLLEHFISATINSDTGEIIEEKPIQSNSLKGQFEHYHIHFAINKLFGGEFLVILINSKLLEHDYMNGISMKNIELIYNKLMSCQVFYCSFEDFLSLGQVSDIDIKKDVELKPNEFKEIIRQLEKVTKPQKSKKLGCEKFLKSNNLGIEWNTRSSATYTRPFLKLYHKGIETKCSKNREFFSQYIDVESVSNIVRIECTIKSFREAQRHGIKDNSLLSLLKASTSDLNAIIEHSVTANLEPRMKKANRKQKDTISNTELVMLLYLDELIKSKGLSFQTALYHIIEQQPCKTSRNRLKKALTSIFETHIEGNIQESKNRINDDFFNALGWR